VLGVDAERVVEAAPGPGELLAGQVGVRHPHVQLGGKGEGGQPLPQERDRLVVLSFVVELVSLLSVILGTEEGVRHPPGTPVEVSQL
jgi:hypothetical protein